MPDMPICLISQVHDQTINRMSFHVPSHDRLDPSERFPPKTRGNLQVIQLVCVWIAGLEVTKTEAQISDSNRGGELLNL